MLQMLPAHVHLINTDASALVAYPRHKLACEVEFASDLLYCMCSYKANPRRVHSSCATPAWLREIKIAIYATRVERVKAIYTSSSLRAHKRVAGSKDATLGFHLPSHINLLVLAATVILEFPPFATSSIHYVRTATFPSPYPPSDTNTTVEKANDDSDTQTKPPAPFTPTFIE